jgi:uncharacterized SAM-binding protein YcdF (DUF218 family)
MLSLTAVSASRPMFLYLSKILPPFVYPVGLVTILILVALLAARRPRLQRASLLFALGLLLITGNRWVADGLLRSLEWQYLPSENIPNAEVIVLLGGGTLSAEPPRPMIELNSAGDRVLYAAQLYQQGKAENILVSGGKPDWLSEQTSPAEEMAYLLELLQVPAEAIWLEPASRNTYENSLNSRAILEAKGIKRIILVTSAAHMPRAVALFKRQGFEVIPAPTDFRVTQSGWEQLTSGDLPFLAMNLLPSAENMAQTTGALKEYIGLFIYKLRGWL